MQIDLAATVEVSDKYEQHVRRAFDEFLQGLPARIGGLTILETDNESSASKPPASRQPRRKAGG